MRVALWIGIVGLSGLMGLSGCTTRMLHREGMQMVAAGDLAGGLDALERALQIEPRNVVLRKDYALARSAAVAGLLASARRKLEAGDDAGARVELQRVQGIEPGNVAAAQGMHDLKRGVAHAQTVVEARAALAGGDAARAAGLLREILAENPRQRDALALQGELEQARLREHFVPAALGDEHAQPINLEFRDAQVRQILEALARASNVNFIFDKDVPADLRTTIFLRNATLEDAIGLILRNVQLRHKVLNRSTVQIYSDSADKRKEYQELVVRAFYLHDAGAVQIQNVLKSLLKLKDIVVDERLNLVTIRDTPEAIRLAERLVALHDLAEPEVMLELEVLEVQRDNLLKLGIQWPAQFTALLPSGASGTGMTLDELKKLDTSAVPLAFGNPVLNLKQDTGMSNILANPRIRVHNREKANVLIGDKVPVITTTSNATGFVAENVQYLDVGLKLSAEPLIHPSNEVSIRLNLEVSSIASQVSTPNGTVAYQVGTRNASTFLRLRDGETQVLAGLISDQDRHSASGVPGFGRLPILGRLFSAPTDSSSKTEIVLSITPRVVRPALRSAAQPVEFWSGTENGLDTKPMRLAERPVTPPADAAAAAPVGAANVSLPGPSAGEVRAPQFIWSGPNQVRIGDEFVLSLRAIASGAQDDRYRILADTAAFEIVDVLAADPAVGAAAVERATQDLAFTLAAPFDGQLLSLKLRARAPAAPGVLRVTAERPGGADIAPYTITVLP